MNLNPSSPLLAVFLILLVTTSVGLAKPQEDTSSIIFESNIDLTTPLTVEDDEVIQTAYMRATLNSQTTKLYFGDYWITSTLFNSNRIKSEPVKKGLIDTILLRDVQKKELKWVNAIEDVDISQTVYENRLKETITVKNKNAPVEFVFKLSYSEGLNAIEKDNTIVFKDREGTVLVKIEEPYAIDSNGKRYAYKYTLNGDILKLLPVDDVSQAKYPLVIDPSYLIIEDGLAGGGTGAAARIITRTSDGALHTLSKKNYDLVYSKSVDGGHTWTETIIGDGGEFTSWAEASIAADSQDNLHVVADAPGYLAYIKYNGSWQDNVSIVEESPYIVDPAIAVDSQDNLHVVWADNGINNLCYIKHNGTAWSEKVYLNNTYGASSALSPSIGIDYNDYIHIVWRSRSATSTTQPQLQYRKYTHSWSGIEELTTNYVYGVFEPCIAIDSNNYPHIVAENDTALGAEILYLHHNGTQWTELLNLSGCISNNSYRPSISITAGGIIDVVFYETEGEANKRIYQAYSNDGGVSWSSPEAIISVAGREQDNPHLVYAIHPQICSDCRMNIPYTGYAFVYNDYITGPTGPDYVRYYETDTLSWTPRTKFNLDVRAKDVKTGTTINNFTAEISPSNTTDSTDNGVVHYYCLDGNSYELSVSAAGYYVGEKSVWLSDDRTTTIYLTPVGGAGIDFPPHYVEFRVVDIWGVSLINVEVNVTYSEKEEPKSMNGTTDDVGHIGFEMIQNVKYTLKFTNASQGIDATKEIYPKDDRYTITIGEIPEQKIAYWITTEQNNTANTANITLHYNDYNSPVKTNWVNFSIYYLDNDTLAYTYNFTTPIDVNENTSTNLNATYSYKVKGIADHDDIGVFTWYAVVVFVMPEKPKLPVVETMKDALSDWQIQLFSLFVIILFALIFGGASQGVAGLVVSFLAVALHVFGMMPLVPVLAGAVIYPLIVVMSIVNVLSERKEEPA